MIMSYPTGEERFSPDNLASEGPMSQELAHFLSHIPLINPPVFPNFKQINCAGRLLRDTISIARRQPTVQPIVQADQKQLGGNG
jgi:hypothetical protein